jgi:hypothetical protein
MIMLSLPVDSPSVAHSVQTFLWWAILQGAVILMQNRYQRRRMYTRIALGKCSAMDVVAGESSASAGQLLLLYPLLFALQGLQVRRGLPPGLWPPRLEAAAAQCCGEARPPRGCSATEPAAPPHSPCSL